MKGSLGDAKYKLDKEQLKSADLENRYAQLEEDLNFKLSLVEKELAEVEKWPRHVISFKSKYNNQIKTKIIPLIEIHFFNRLTNKKRNSSELMEKVPLRTSTSYRQQLKICEIFMMIRGANTRRSSRSVMKIK